MKYFNFAIILLSNFIIKLLKYININNFFIYFIDNKQLFYNLIYS